ncbi:alpha-2C adrenergic receptor-like [Branchiostoma lanceolatum]|uniref:alpha-2C adrenergic receptor-like n=1 Tax=Branchiostoma lanceolatum TaxID=7740 RepID=UPI0034572B3E
MSVLNTSWTGNGSTAGLNTSWAVNGSTAGLNTSWAVNGSTAGLNTSWAVNGSTAGLDTSWAVNGSTAGLNTSWAVNGSTAGPTAAGDECISFGQDVVNAFVDSSFAEDKLHVIVFLGVVCALGTTGNLLVILVNARRKDKSSAAIFVLTLAVVDLFICALKIPLKMVEMQHVTYTSTMWCKSSPYFTLASLLSSVFLLTAIAVDRYRAVARPVSYRVAKNRSVPLVCVLTVLCYVPGTGPCPWNRSVPLVCVLTVLAGFLLSIPAVLLQDEVPGIRVGPACETVSFCSSVGGVTHGRIYFGATAAVFFASVLAMAVLYALVYKHVMDLVHPLPQGASVWAALQRRLPHPGAGIPTPSGLSIQTTDHQAPHTDNRHPENLETSQKPDQEEGKEHSRASPPTTSHPNLARTRSTPSHPDADRARSPPSHPDPDRTRLPPSHPDPAWPRSPPSHPARWLKKTRLSTVQRQYRVAKLLLLVTSVFILSWLPYWVISLYDVDKPSWLLLQPEAVKRTVVFFSNFYFINNAANPIIYTFVQKDFRDRLVKLFKCSRI